MDFSITYRIEDGKVTNTSCDTETEARTEAARLVGVATKSEADYGFPSQYVAIEKTDETGQTQVEVLYDTL